MDFIFLLTYSMRIILTSPSIENTLPRGESELLAASKVAFVGWGTVMVKLDRTARTSDSFPNLM